MNTLEILRDILIKDYKVEPEKLLPAASLSELGVDSLGMLELMFEIEDRFDVKIPGDPPSDLLTVQDVVTYIDGLIAGRPAAAAVAPAAAPNVGP